MVFLVLGSFTNIETGVLIAGFRVCSCRLVQGKSRLFINVLGTLLLFGLKCREIPFLSVLFLKPVQLLQL